MKNLLILFLIICSSSSYAQFNELKLIPTTETCGCYSTTATKYPLNNSKLSIVDITIYRNAIAIGNTTWVHRSDTVWYNGKEFAVLEENDGKYQLVTKKYVYVFRNKSNG